MRWRRELAELRKYARDLILPSVTRDATAEQLQRWEDRSFDILHRERGGYPYGQAIGWLRVVHDGPPGPVVKGYAYKLRQSRFQRRFRQEHFEWQGKAFETWFLPSSQSNVQITSELRSVVLESTKSGGDDAR